MYEKTQQWQVQPIRHAGWLGFFRLGALLLYLVFWVGQYSYFWALLAGVGGGIWWLRNTIFLTPPANTLEFSPPGVWLLSRSMVQPQHMWCSPYFCTLLLHVSTEFGSTRQWVVCWRHHHTLAQWCTLVRLLLTGIWTSQAMRNH